jgi:glutamate racemase
MVGFYDSGLGGVTILKQVNDNFPDIKTMYLADTLHCPLGEKTNAEILAYTKSGVSFLFDHGCNLVLLACNTATAVTIRELQNNWLPANYPDKKILGIIRPVSEKMLEIHTNKSINIGILATPATIQTRFYEEEMKSVGYNNLFSIPCIGLADSIENQNLARTNELLDNYFSRNVEQIRSLDVMIFACTHYPIIRNEIMQKLLKYGAKPSIKLLTQGIMVAKRLNVYLQNHPEIEVKKGENIVLSTSNQLDFQIKMKDIFGLVVAVKQVVLE